MHELPFDRNKHVYHNTDFVELVKDAVRFFNGTPIYRFPLVDRFLGTGVYALYYTGSNKYYSKYSELNRLSYDFPIYVGKAVPKGWRQSRTSDEKLKQSYELFSRLKEHSRNIDRGSGINIEDFTCRFVIFEGDASDMIGTIEAALIKLNKPLWNSAMDGFGNHTPGKGRFNQAKSDWDVIHPGRDWADKCTGLPRSKDIILSNISNHMKAVG